MRRELVRASNLVLISMLLSMLIVLHAYAQTVRVWGPVIVYAEVKETIDRGTYYYLRDAVKLAEELNTPLIVYIETPGGYLDAALDIVSLFDKSRIPVIVYAGGSIAVSAGTLILLAAPVAYTASHTVIGSMQPVLLTPEGVKPVNESKVVNTLSKIIEVHCRVYGRNYSVARLFITRNLNLDGIEALHLHVIDGVADTLEQLLIEVNGTRVRLFNGIEGLILLNGSVIRLEKPLGYRMLSLLSNPVVSSLLLSLGSLIVAAAILSGHPGFGAIGLLLLILGLAGLGFSPNTLALILILVGALLLAIDLLVVPGVGVPGATGAIMLILGFALLPLTPTLLVSHILLEKLLYTALTIGGFFAALFLLIAWKVASTIRKKPVYEPNMLGKVGIAVDDIPPGGTGFVIIDGEYWMARSREGVRRGEKVKVVGKDGPVLIIEKLRGSAG